MALGMEVGLGPGHIVLDGDPTPPKGHTPNFPPMSIFAKRLYASGYHLVRRQASAQAIVLDGDPAELPLNRGTVPSSFGPCLLWPNSWMDQDATWYEGRPRSRPHCVRWGHCPPGNGRAFLFSAHVYCGQTVPHVSCC